MWKWRFICWLIDKTSRTRGKRIARLRKLRDHVSRDLETLVDHWTVVNSIPKVGHRPASLMGATRRVAVVVQGPLMLENDFTLESFRVHQRSLPGADLILSTWESSDAKTRATLDAIEAMGVRVLREPPPTNPGPKNINYQLVSTLRGVQEARRRGAEFVLKTRADTRLGAPDIGQYLVGLAETFPLTSPCRQHRRLLVLDLCTRLFLPHHPSDILMFGHVDDMIRYWSAPLNPVDVAERKPRTVGDLLAFPIPEIYLCEHYLNTIAYPFERTVASWWRVLADLFLVVDRATLQFFWPKYAYLSDQRYGTNDEARNMALCSFREWVSLYAHDAPCPVEINQLAEARVNAPVETGRVTAI